MSDITSPTALRNSLLAVADILDTLELTASREGRPYEWSPAQAVRDAVEELDRLSHPHLVVCNNPVGSIGRAGCICKVVNVNDLRETEEARTKLAALFALLDIEEDSELTGKSFRPNHFTSCRALDGEQMGKLLVELKAWATSTP